MNEYITIFFSCVAETATVVYFLNHFYEKQVPPRVFYPLCVVFTLMQFANNILFLDKSYLIILTSTVFIYSITILFHFAWYKKIWVSVLVNLISIYSEASVGIVFGILFKNNVADIKAEPFVFVIATLLSKFTAFIIICFLRKIEFNPSAQIIKKNIILIFPLPVTSYVMMAALLHLFLNTDSTR